jgi:hypothetical protein
VPIVAGAGGSSDPPSDGCGLTAGAPTIPCFSQEVRPA